MYPPNLIPIELEVQQVVKTRRIRIAEFFKDYDRLRSGKISQSQFIRSLNQVLGSARSDNMKPAEEEALVKKYKDANGMIDYQAFSSSIDTCHDPNKTDNLKHLNQLNEDFQYLGVKKMVSNNSMRNITAILEQLEPFYDYHGVDLRREFEDFARHNNGVITSSQFQRSFPGRETLSNEDLEILTNYYIDNNSTISGNTTLINYLNFQMDIERMRTLRKNGGLSSLSGGGTNNNGSAGDSNSSSCNKDGQHSNTNSNLSSGLTAGINNSDLPADLCPIFDRLHVAIFKNRIRTTEFFRDHDKLRSGLITINQFIRGLTLAQDGVQLGASLLTESEISRIADFYSVNEGSAQGKFVNYRKFCTRMENTFNIPDLERHPTQEPIRPNPRQLQTKLADLSKDEESRLRELIADIKQYVNNRRIMLYPYFKDFDRGAGYTRTVTKGQFTRILNFSGVKLSPTDLDIVYRKYRDPVTDDVLYPAFSVAVEDDFSKYYVKDEEDIRWYGMSVDHFKTGSGPSKNLKDGATGSSCKNINSSNYNQEIRDQFKVKSLNVKKVHKNSINECIDQLKKYVFTNRIRVEDFFKDFDALRTGLVTKSRFLRCLDAMDVSGISPSEQITLAEFYGDKSKTDCVRWQEFVKDIDTQYTSSMTDQFTKTCGLPAEPIPPKAKVPGQTTLDEFTAEEQETIKNVLNRMTGRVERRRVHLKPVFQDFDKHNDGYVTAAQFTRVLTLLNLGCTEEESKLLTTLYSDHFGFNYDVFIHTLAPKRVENTKYEEQLAELQTLGKKTTNQATGLKSERYATMLSKSEDDMHNMAMIRLKTLVFKERIRVYEFMKDYDKLRSGSIPKNDFRRALDLCGVGDVLVEPEIVSIMEAYKSTEKPDFVDYLRLSKELETVFTNSELDRNPCAKVEQFRPPVEWEKNDLEDLEENIFKTAMYRLGEHIKKTRIQLYPLFEDYDRVHNATVSRSQFHRVLSELEMGGLLSEQEFRVIFKKFNMTRGGKNDVNYVAFCDWFKDCLQENF